jgi:hypothetical protein
MGVSGRCHKTHSILLDFVKEPQAPTTSATESSSRHEYGQEGKGRRERGKGGRERQARDPGERKVQPIKNRRQQRVKPAKI